MVGTCVVGLQWGDEAKGKIVDLLGDRHDFVVRYNGGANAGHTIVHGGKTFKLSLLPSGVLRPEITSVIGCGVVVDPVKFIEEVTQLRAAGVPVGANLALSDRAHVIFPHHREEDRLNEGAAGGIGTTGRGIGPCYADKVGRVCGVRVGELLRPDHLRERLGHIIPRKNRLLAALADGTGTAERFDAAKVVEQYLRFAETLRPFIVDTTKLLQEAVNAGKRLLFEAAQGSLLDVDHGTYPFVTSSNSSPAGIWGGSGVSPRQIGRVIGVVKAYSTRVGKGPLVTELHDDTAHRIRETGNEYGTVTRRPRRVGWFDAVATRYSAAIAGADEITLMLLDVLSVVPEVKLCTAYRLPDGRTTTDLSADADLLGRCEPVYETMPGWNVDITGARKPADLPPAARRYADRVAELVGRPLAYVSVGPDREQTIPFG